VLDLGVAAPVRIDALVAPGKMVVELAPLRLGALQCQPGERAELVACVLERRT